MSVDGIEILTYDHRQVEQLFSEIEGGSADRDDVVDKIVRELSVHDFVEREELYPLVRKRIPEGGERLSEQCLDGHKDIAHLLLDIKSKKDVSERDPLLQEVIADVRAHVQVEESQVFPKLRQALSDAQLIELGSRIEAARFRAPTLPHPHTPSSRPGAMLVGAAETVVDSIHNTLGGEAKGMVP